jgi:hypothetical protein
MMARRLLIAPNGWPCTLAECPPGHFVYQGSLCFKTEYRCSTTPDRPAGKIEAYCESGEFFVAGAASEADREKIIVQPVSSEWISDDE